MEALLTVYSGDSLRCAQAVLNAVGALRGTETQLQFEDKQLYDATELHPMDRSALANGWMRWLKECVLRKQELERLEYLKWLREQREVSIKGKVESLESSGAWLYHSLLIPLIRYEIQQGENEKPLAESLNFSKITRMVVEGQMDNALESLWELVAADKRYRHCEHDMVHLLSEFRHYEEKERKGLLDHETIRVARNQIRDSLLSTIRELQEIV